jgi:hypothetical protein
VSSALVIPEAYVGATPRTPRDYPWKP